MKRLLLALSLTSAQAQTQIAADKSELIQLLKDDCATPDADISQWDTSLITDMSELFSTVSCRENFNKQIGNWETSQVTNMARMFEDARAFNQPIGSWDTSQVTNMGNMFNNAWAFNQPIGGWDTSQVTNMRDMFGNARAFNQPIGSWDTYQVTNMGNMFNNAWAFNQPLDSWNVGNVVQCSQMFFNAYSLTYAIELVFNQYCSSFLLNTKSGTGECGDRTHMTHGASRIQDGTVHSDVVQCQAGALENVELSICAEEGCIDDNSICCHSPCETHTDVTSCSGGSSMCWWDADESKCQRLCDKDFKIESQRVCSDNALALADQNAILDQCPVTQEAYDAALQAQTTAEAAAATAQSNADALLADAAKVCPEVQLANGVYSVGSLDCDRIHSVYQNNQCCGTC